LGGRDGIPRTARQEVPGHLSALTAALAGLEPGSPGRPPQTPSPEDERLQALEAQLTAQDLELRTARAREEIVLTLPRVVPEPEKKRRPPSGQRRGSAAR
jgi:hypothetical protein